MKIYGLIAIIVLILIGAMLFTQPRAVTIQPTVTVFPVKTAVTPVNRPTSTAAIPDAEATELMDILRQSTAVAAETAIERILAANDQCFIAVFIELLRGRQLGLVNNLGLERYAGVLEDLSGQTFGPDWPAWVEWYGRTDLSPPPGFTGWKGRLLAVIDPGFGEFLQDQHASRIRIEEIQWGGVRIDGIPALDNPAMLPAIDAAYLDPEDVVFGLFINGESRAYPLRIMDWHEMANDIVGGVPVSLAYCTLCGAAIAYDGRFNGQTYTFGSSGFLFRSNKLMYDRQTRTLWNQLTGQPALGELVDSDVMLDILPVVLTTWEEWQSQHQDTLVLDINTGYSRNYTPGAAYGNYFASDETMFPVAQRSDILDTKDQVYVIRLDGVPKAYPIALLTEEQIVNDILSSTNVVLIAPGGSLWVNGDNRFAGEVIYSVGGEVRAYDRGDEVFTLSRSGQTVIDAAGNTWQVTEDALVGPEGQIAPRLGGHLAYWFGWYAFFPNTLVYGQ